MSTLNTRLEKLEVNNIEDELIVIILRFGGDGEYCRAKGNDNQIVERLPNEDEETFIDRARTEIVATTKRQIGPRPCYVVQVSRNALST